MLRERLQEKRRRRRNRIIKRIILIFLILGLVGYFIFIKDDETVANNNENNVVSQEEIENKNKKESEPKEIIKEEYVETYEKENEDDVYNDLTGIWKRKELDGVRPAAIIINNHNRAIPQSGISKADIIYEIPVEGEFTRLLALFTDIKKIDKVGPIRSSRDYFLEKVFDHDAVYVHYGANPSAYMNSGTFNTLNTPNIDGHLGKVSGMLTWRDKSRVETRGMEHSAYSNGDYISKAWDIMDYRENKDVNKEYSFVEDKSIEGEKVDEITLNYTDYYKSRFKYNKDIKKYERYQFYNVDDKKFKEHIDAENDEQIKVKNIIIQFVNINLIPGDKAGRKNVSLVGKGTGYFITNGKHMPIKWQKSAHRKVTEYTTLEGEELELNKGKTFICVFDKDEKENVTLNVEEKKEIEDGQENGSEVDKSSSES